jgi:steroid 5-alpha reductase family enzyme
LFSFSQINSRLMSPFILLPLQCLACVSILMAIIWIWAVRIKNAGIVDIFWAFNFAIIAIIIKLFAEESLRKNIVCALALLWSLRLGIYLAKRVGSHLDEEEGRYKQLRREWTPHVNLKFFIFFQMQAFSNVFLAIPFFITSLNPEPQLSPLEIIGASLWFLSIMGEAISDRQLQLFKKDLANKGKVCQYGLWKYSRHPNYFFQLMIWISVFIFSLNSPYGWIAIICPLVIGYLIFKVTGIPMTEEQSIRSKGELYKEYQQTTSAFIPWFKKK